MNTQLSKAEISKLLATREKELEEKQKELEDIANHSFEHQYCKMLEGKIEVYERIMTFIENYYLKGEE